MSASPVDYEEVLASEGLAPIGPASPTASSQRPRTADDAEAVEMYQRWACDVLATHAFTTPRQRRIWEMYADGATYGSICLKLCVARKAVSRAVEDVTKAAPPAPVVNPWRHSGHPSEESLETQIAAAAVQADQRLTGRLFALAWKCADRERLRALMAADKELSRLLPQGGTIVMAESKQRLEYAEIRFKGAQPMPGRHRDVDRILNVEGRPHAGGIDIELDGQVRTVPWHLIVFAARAVQDKPGPYSGT